MKRRLLALLLCAALVFSLFGCTQEPAPAETTAPTTPTEATTAPTEPPVTDRYAAAKAPIVEADDLKLVITRTKTLTIGSETFQLDSEQRLTYTGIGTDGLQVTLTEEMSMENTDDKFEEYYSGGMLYTTVYDEFRFKGAVDEAEYLAQFAPAVLLDDGLYSDITATQEGDGTMLLFNSPSAPESWALPEGAEFHAASGSVLLDANGALVESTYTIDYTYGGFRITEEISSVPTIPETVTLTAPDDSAYTEIDSIEAIRLYDMAVMYLCAANSATTNLSETIVSQAAACVFATQNLVDYYGTNSNHISNIDYTITVQQGGQTDTYRQTEHFQDHTYTISVDGGTPEENGDVNAPMMAEYSMGYLSENIISLGDISSAKVTEAGNVLYIELGCTEDYGQWLCEYACGILFEDEGLLTELATAYALTDCSSYMAVDKYTGMPTAVGILYNATHTIDGVDYILSLQADQSFSLASQTAYETITGEPLPEEEPETQATPLFYRVTGEDGQEMWLLGTIHIGDERTAYLPQEIYDALEASDALAVEFDTLAFEEAMETDQTLAAQIAAAYIYADGTTTKDHLDEETYEAAIKLLKASGNYNAAAEMMKPSIWQQSIANFYIQQSYGLQYDKGVDMRLLKLAKEKGMEILDIESGIAQIQMMTGYSDALQALLLEELLDADPMEYYAETVDLYEKWCAGDEAVLREALADDLSELTEEELALYEEYNKAMLIDRNAGMLQVAIEYLESGETVFYAVGLAHLLTGNGLVDTLREAGYTVELVTFG